MLVESATHQSGSPGAVAGREQDNVQNRYIRARFALTAYVLRAGFFME